MNDVVHRRDQAGVRVGAEKIGVIASEGSELGGLLWELWRLKSYFIVTVVDYFSSFWATLHLLL